MRIAVRPRAKPSASWLCAMPAGTAKATVPCFRQWNGGSPSRPPICATSPTCATTAASACMPVNTRRLTSSRSTCPERSRNCGWSPTSHTPGPLSWSRAFRRNSVGTSLALTAGMIGVMLLLTILMGNPDRPATGRRLLRRPSPPGDGGGVWICFHVCAGGAGCRARPIPRETRRRVRALKSKSAAPGLQTWGGSREADPPAGPRFRTCLR